jgi:hypothetical protein
MTTPEPIRREPGDFDHENFKAPIFDGLTIEDFRTMPIGEKGRRIVIARQQAQEAHRAWFLAREPEATEVDVWADWMRVNHGTPILAKAMRDAAEREADTPFIVEVTDATTNVASGS